MKNFKNSGLNLVLIAGLLLLIQGCLSVETKEYYYEINPDGSGTGKITYYNIVSEEDDEANVSFSDFGELIDDYLLGGTFESENPSLTVITKDLFERDGVLVGEVEFTFENADSIGFWRDPSCSCSGYNYYLGSLSETFISANGTYLGENRELPIISWDSDATQFQFTTRVKDDMSDAHNLLPLYNTWLETRD